MQYTTDLTAAVSTDEVLDMRCQILTASTEFIFFHKCLIFHFSQEGTLMLIFLESTKKYIGICWFKADP